MLQEYGRGHPRRQHHRGGQFGQEDGGMKDENEKEQRLEVYLQKQQKEKERQRFLENYENKKNQLLGTNVMEIQAHGNFPMPQSKSQGAEEEDDDIGDIELDSEALGMLEDLVLLDEEIEDNVDNNDLNRGITYSRKEQKMRYI